MRYPTARLACSLFLILAACGGGDKGTGPANTTPPNGSLTAKVDGTSWTAAAAVAGTFTNGILSIAGTGANRTLGFAFVGTNPGTYPVGSLSGTNATLIEGSRGWQAVSMLGNGSVTLTSISATRAVGTFSFNLVANAGTGATGTRAVTEGSFNVSF